MNDADSISYMTHDIILSLSHCFSLFLSCALWHISSGWSIPIFSNWWTSSRPKKSTSSSLNCEFRCLMTRGKRLSTCLCGRSGLPNCVCWLYTRGEWAVVAWGLVDMRTALNSTHLVFRHDCLPAAPFSSACVLGEFDTFPWICQMWDTRLVHRHLIRGVRNSG